jgi:hypothetical protein
MRRLRPTGIAGIAVVFLLAASVAGTAIAYFTTTGTGSSAAKTVSALAQPAIATATPGVGGTVSLSWGAVTPPGTGNITYKVERNGGGASGTCASTPSATTCVDSGLAAGTYTYVVTAKWRSWTTSSTSKAATVTVGPADRLVLSAASSTPTAGAADNLTITAKDAGGGTVTTYTGSKSLTFSGAPTGPDGAAPTVSDSSGAEIAFGGATAIEFSAGVATVTGGKNGVMKLYKSGAASVNVSDGSISTKAPLAVTVSPATASQFALTAETTSPVVGAANNLTITARDAYGNVATSYTGSKNLTFSGASASPSGKTPTVANSSGTATNFGSTTAISFTAGVAAVSTTKNGVMRLYRSGEANIAVSDGSVTTKAPLEVTASPAAASKFVLTAATTTPAAGAVDNLTTTAQDEYGNIATSYAGAKSLTFSGASASPGGSTPTVSDSSGAEIAFGGATAIEFSAGVATVSSGKNGAMKLYKIGSTSLKATDGSLTTPTALTVTVAATATRFLLSSSATSMAAGGSANLTITALDAYENTVTTYTGSKSLTFSGASASPNGTKPTVVSSSGSAVNFGSATTISFSSGVAIVSASKNGLMKLYDAEEAAITVSARTISNQLPLKVTVGAATTSKLALTAATTTPVIGASDNLTTTAQDTYGNVTTAYTGAKSLTFSGASASPSGAVPTVSDSSGTDVPFGTAMAIDFNEGIASVSGTKNGVMKLYKSGSTTVQVSDGSFSTTLSVTVAAASATKFLLASSASTLAANGTANLTTTAQDTYGNTVTAYTGAKTLTYSGASASPNGTAPTVVNSGNTATALGSPTAINFTNGVASVSSSRNGLLRLYRAESASISVSDGTISSAAPVAITVSPTTATRWGITNITISAGTLGSNCLFTCSLTGLGNSGTVNAKVAVTDAYGNTVSAVGSGHAAKVAVTGGSGTISGTPLAIPATGAAESATTFTYTSKSSGGFTETVTASASEGTAYTAATLTATK